MSVVPQQVFAEYIRDELGALDAAIQQSALDAADRSIFKVCQRQFVVAGPATVRVYAPRNQSEVIRIHDCTSVTAVTNDGTNVTSGNYQLEPLNGIAWSGELWPYEQIGLIGNNTGTRYWRWDGRRATVSVTATWGWPEIPEDIYEAAKILAKDILSMRDIKAGVVDLGAFGAVRVRENATVKGLIWPFRREEAKSGLGWL